jgi:outer membrane cobalamin receptor
MKVFVLGTIILLISGLFGKVFSQCFEDTIFQIEQVDISAKALFNSENAGMKHTHVDSLLIQNKINQNLSELILENTSVFIKNNGRGALSTASFRGTSASHTGVIWNGLELSDPTSGTVDFSLIPMYIVDEIQILHGAASLISESGNLGGSIILNNQANWKNRFELQYLQGIGSFSSFDEMLFIGIGNTKLQSKTRIYHNFSKNNFTFINRSIGSIDPLSGDIIHPLDTNSNAEYTKYGLLQEFYFRPAKNHLIEYLYWGQNSQRGIPRVISYEGHENSGISRQSDMDHKFLGNWKYYFPKGKLLFTNAYAIKKLSFNVKNQISGLSDFASVNSINISQTWQNNTEWNYKIIDKLPIRVGIKTKYQHISSTDSVTQVSFAAKRLNVSLISGVHHQIAKKINLNLIIRKDFIDKIFQPLLPYIGFDYKPFKDYDFILKGNISRNFHIPEITDLYWQPGGNPDLLPEIGNSTEMGVEYAAKIKNTHISTSVSTYYSDIQNWIIWIPSYLGYWESQNIEKVISQGIEASLNLTGEIHHLNYRFFANYAMTHSRNFGDPKIWGADTYGKQLVYIPVHSGNLMFQLSWKNYSIAWQHTSFSERYTTTSNNVTKRDWLYPYFMNDLSFAKSFKIKSVNIRIDAKILNLFNETYHSVLYRPMPGRNYMLYLIVTI